MCPRKHLDERELLLVLCSSECRCIRWPLRAARRIRLDGSEWDTLNVEIHFLAVVLLQERDEILCPI
jgi:hypothetical protein